ncbi:hypothetical protein BH10PSE19_BH10PSE19_17530 [soil metagenome]
MKQFYRYFTFVIIFIFSFTLLNGCSNFSGTSASWGPQAPGTEAIPNEPAALWKFLQQRSVPQLQNMLQSARNNVQRGWIELALISKQTLNDQQLSNALQNWSQTYPNHPAHAYVPKSFTPATITGQTPHKIALILPLHGLLGGAGQAVRDGFLAAYYVAQQQGASTTVNIIDSADKPDTQALYREAVANGADFVVGPLDKDNVEALKRMGSLPVPTLALNASDTSTALIPQLYQFALSPLDEANQVADKAWADGRRNVILITPKGSWGNNIANVFTNRWQSRGGKVVDTLVYSQGQNLSAEVKRLLQYNESARGDTKSDPSARRRQDFDMIFLVALPQFARQIRPLLSFYYLGNLPVYSISLIYNGVPDSNLYRDMNGVVFCDIPWLYNNPILNTPQRQQIAKLWSNPFHNYARLYALGLDAFKLSSSLHNLPTNANAGIPGATGRLYLGQDHRILRKLVWVQFRNGHPVMIGE